MQLSWRGVNVLLLTTSTVMFATEGHLIAFTPLQLRELGLDEAEVGVWTGILVAVTMSMALPLGALAIPLIGLRGLLVVDAVLSLAAGVVGSGLWTAFAIGSLGYAASVVTGVKLGRVRSASREEPVPG